MRVVLVLIATLALVACRGVPSKERRLPRFVPDSAGALQAPLQAGHRPWASTTRLRSA